MVHFLYRIRKKLLKYYSEDFLDIHFAKVIEEYYKMFAKRKKGIKNQSKKRSLIISLTTIPERIDSVWITIESLLRQTYKPDRIILWLSKDEFEEIELPIQLKQQEKRGLTIKYCGNLRSYKKFFYTVKENSQAYVITVDDDLIYSEKMVEVLVRDYAKNPRCVICNRSNRMKMRNNKLLPYSNWEMYEKRSKIMKEPSYQNFFTSGGGTLFPFFLMDKRLLEDDVFMELAPTADDVWLNFIAWVSGLKTKNTEDDLGYLIHIPNSAKKGLYRQNVLRNQNDVQIKKVIEYLDINVKDYL